MPWTELEFGASTWLLLVGAGAVLGMDAVSWPQVMISRPLVSATIGGWMAGSPASGLLVGAVLELYSLRHAPLGAARYPDTGPAGLVAGSAFAASGGTSAGGFLVALVIGWGLGWVGAVTEHVRRRVNERLTTPASDLAADPRLLEKRHRLAIRLDALRGAVLVGSLVVPAVLITAVAAGASTSSLAGWAMSSLVLGIAASAGAAARTSAFGIRGWPLFVIGAVVAGLLLLGVAP